MKLSFRPAAGSGTDDRQFIVSTWSSSWKGSNYAGVISAERWSTVMRPELDAHLERPDARVIIACDRNDPTYFYGWIAGDVVERPAVVWYVYVKEPYRRAGIARQLFHRLGVDPLERFIYACGAPIAIRLAHKIPLAKLNPNGLRYTKETRRDPL